MVFANVEQFQRGAAERDDFAVVDDLVGHDDIRGLQRLDAFLGIAMRNEGRAQILERLTASGVVEMTVAVNDVFDRRLGHGLNGVDIGFCRPPQADRIGGDHACRRDDEHRLMTDIAEEVDVVGDLGGRGWGRRCCSWRGRGNLRRSRRLLLSPCNQGARNKCRSYARIIKPLHGRPPMRFLGCRFSKTLRTRKIFQRPCKILRRDAAGFG